MKIRDSTLPLLAEYARSGRVVVFDTETTGGRSYDEICQIAAVEYVNGTMTRTLALYVCPTCEMNPWAEAVHGLSLDFLNEYGLALAALAILRGACALRGERHRGHQASC